MKSSELDYDLPRELIAQHPAERRQRHPSRPARRSCPACSRFSRAYLRHLVSQRELLGLRLLSLHNLRFLLDVTAGARTAIERGELQAFKTEALERLSTESKEVSCQADS